MQGRSTQRSRRGRTTEWRARVARIQHVGAAAVEQAPYQPQILSTSRQFNAKEVGIALAITMMASTAFSLNYRAAKHAERPPSIPQKGVGVNLSDKAMDVRAAFEGAFTQVRKVERLQAKEKERHLDMSDAKALGAAQ